MLFSTSLGVNSVSAKQVVKCEAGGSITANRPVGVYCKVIGSGTASDPYSTKLMCIALDASGVNADSIKGQWGVSEVGGSAGDTIDVVVHGLAKVASGGAKNNLVTAISNGGVVTDASAGSTNADLALAVCLDADEIFIY